MSTILASSSSRVQLLRRRRTTRAILMMCCVSATPAVRGFAGSSVRTSHAASRHLVGAHSPYQHRSGRCFGSAVFLQQRRQAQMHAHARMQPYAGHHRFNALRQASSISTMRLYSTTNSNGNDVDDDVTEQLEPDDTSGDVELDGLDFTKLPRIYIPSPTAASVDDKEVDTSQSSADSSDIMKTAAASAAMRTTTTMSAPVTARLRAKSLVTISADQSHYLLNVMRLSQPKRWGDLTNYVRIFNGEDGEWLAKFVIAALDGGISGKTKKRKRRGDVASSTENAVAECVRKLRPQDSAATPRLKVHLYMAPPKKQQRKWALEKLTELGVDGIHFLDTEFSTIDRKDWDPERNRLHVWEAAEQCERLTVPSVSQHVQPLSIFIKTHWQQSSAVPTNEAWFICQERSKSEPMADALRDLSPAIDTVNVLVGPEGGWSPSEVELFAQHATAPASPSVQSVSLGSLVLRAETASITSAAAIMLHNDSSQ